MNNKCAEIIELNIESLTIDWMQAIHENDTVRSSEDLSELALRDHVQQVIREIAELLRQNIAPDIANTREARVAAYTRYKLTYRLRDLVVEIGLLRQTILDCLGEGVLDSKMDLMLSEYVRAVQLINGYLDEELRYSASIFSESGAAAPE